MVRLLVFLALAGCSDALTDKGKDPSLADTGDTDADTDADTDTDTDTDADTDADTDTDTLPPRDDDADGYDAEEDCDDDDPSVHPGAEELCDGKDNNCDGRFDIDFDEDADGLADCEDYCPVYAAPGASGDGRVSDPMPYLQDAIDEAAATLCYEVRAYEGRYEENLVWRGEPVNVESVSGPDVTTIDGGSVDSVLTFEDAEEPDARVYGFTITNGGGGDGPGVRVWYASPTIEGNVISGNVANAANWLGGGIRVYEGSPSIVDNIIAENDAGFGGPEDGSDGGGINIRGGSPWIENNWIVDNSAGDGGGIWVAYSDALIVGNIISGNIAMDDDPEAGGQGGGINVQIAGTIGPWILNNIISDNVAAMYGGGIVAYEQNDDYPAAQISNNTIAFNEVTDTDYGGGVCQWRRTTPVFTNNIIAFNVGVGVYSEDDMDSDFTYNLVYGNDTNYDGLSGSGAGNISADPQFVDATDNGVWDDDDFRLEATSPAIDAGDPSIDDDDLSRSDMGAYGG